MDRDKLFGATDPTRLRQQAFLVISRTQDDPEVQLQAMGIALYATCEALGVDVKELLTSCERMKNMLDGPFVYVFRSIEEYARNEIGRR